MIFRIPESRNPSEDVGVDRRIVLKCIVRSEGLEWIYLLQDTDYLQTVAKRMLSIWNLRRLRHS